MTPSETAELRTFISGELQKVHTRLGGVEEGLGGLREDQARMESLSASQFANIESRLINAETAREETRRDFSAFREDLKSTNRKLDESRDDMRRGFQEQREH